MTRATIIPRDKLLLLTGLFFGTRISEALSLNFEDVAGKYLQIKSQKGSNNQVFPISEKFRMTVELVRAEYFSRSWEINPTTALFLNRSGVRMSRQAASNIIRQIAHKCGLDGKINTHSLRKSFITRIYEMTNFNLAETKNYSRHKSLASLDAYLKTTETTELCKKLDW
jgi:site-specific recombinase XerD